MRRWLSAVWRWTASRLGKLVPTRLGRLIPSRLTRRRAFGLAGLGALIVAGAVVAPTLRGGEAQDSGLGSALGTAIVELRTLVQTERTDGTLDFGPARTIAAGSNGTVTWVAPQGSIVGRGEDLFSIDRRPTALLFGEVPMYRDLVPGVDPGPDIAQLEENLAELGHFSGTPDNSFGSATASALSAWQRDREVEVTGEARRGDVVFLPGALRVAGAPLDPGAFVQPETAVLEYTSSEHAVRVQLDASRGDLAQVGDTVTVLLPDGTQTTGTVSTVAETGSTEAAGAGAQGGQGGGQDAGLEVTIGLDEPEAAARYTTASVSVDFVRNTREDVLAVPVEALLAVAGAGYVLETPSGGGSTELISVRPGMFADGWVEVSGDGLAEGMTVLVPTR